MLSNNSKIPHTENNPVGSFLTSGVSTLEREQLISELSKRGLITSGTVPELKTRLLQYFNGEAIPSDYTAFEEQNFAPILNQPKYNMETTKTPFFKPTSFSGQTHENISTFLRNYQRAAIINGWSDEHKAQFIIAYLEGPALTFYENTENNLLKNTKWADIEAKLIAEFEPVAQKDMLRLQVENRKQSDDEPTLTYINEIESLCKLINPSMSQNEMIRYMMKGLKPAIARYIGILENNTINELKTNVRKYEKIEFMITGRSTQSPAELKYSMITEHLNIITDKFNEKFDKMEKTINHLSRPQVSHNKNYQENDKFIPNPNYIPPLMQQKWHKYNDNFTETNPTYKTINNFTHKQPQNSYTANNTRNNDNTIKKCEICHYNNHNTSDCYHKNNPIQCQLCDKIGHNAKQCKQIHSFQKN